MLKMNDESKVLTSKNKIRHVENSDPGKILDLVMHLTDDACADLQARVNSYLMEECESDVVFQLIVNEDRQIAFIETVGAVTLRRRCTFPISSFLADVIKKGFDTIAYLNNLDIKVQDLIEPQIHKEDMEKIRMVLYPISKKPFYDIFCVVLPRAFEEHVVLTIQECLMFVWTPIHKSLFMEYQVSLKQKCQILLRVARRLCTKATHVNALRTVAQEQARMLTKAEQFTMMIVDIERMQLTERVQIRDPVTKMTRDIDRRFPMNIGIVGEVIRTGNLINAPVASLHPAFNKDIDTLPDINIKSILFFPIREQTGIVGVGKLCNKILDDHFDNMDEEMAMSFSLFCGMSLIQALLYEKLKEAHIRSAIASEMTLYHMKVLDFEVDRMLACDGFHNHQNLDNLVFDDRELPPRELTCYIMRMFMESNCCKKYNLVPRTLAQFILQVKKGYRDVPFHNFNHAFSVTQWAFAAIKRLKLVFDDYFTDLQGFMFLVAALVHDIDHRGNTMTFIVNGKTTLAALYTSEGSVLERHHLSQALSILNTEGCEILDALPRLEYEKALMLLRDYILATDIGTYFKNLDNYKTIVTDFQVGSRLHSSTLQSLMMLAADMNFMLKGWDYVKSATASILNEFFKQVDPERSQIDVPAELAERQNCYIPELQIEFINNSVKPLFEMITTLFPTLAEYTQVFEEYLTKWEGAQPVFAQLPVNAWDSILLSPDLDNLIVEAIREREEARLRALAEEEEEVEDEEK